MESPLTLQRAWELAWNDMLLAMNQLGGVRECAIRALRGEGVTAPDEYVHSGMLLAQVHSVHCAPPATAPALPTSPTSPPDARCWHRKLLESAVGQLFDLFQRNLQRLEHKSWERWRSSLAYEVQPVRELAFELLPSWLELLEVRRGSSGVDSSGGDGRCGDGSGGDGSDDSGRDSSGGDGGSSREEAQPPQPPNLVHLVLSLLVACCDVLCGTFEVKVVVQCVAVLVPWLARHGKGAARAGGCACALAARVLHRCTNQQSGGVRCRAARCGIY